MPKDGAPSPLADGPADATGTRFELPRAVGKRAIDWIRGSSGGLVVLALAIGLGAGLGAIAFRDLVFWGTRLFTGQTDYAGADHAVHPLLPWLGHWFVVLAPVVGGLLYGPLVERFAPEARGHGVPEVMAAVAAHGGRIRARVAVVKSLASAICIGSGGSVGREGPIVQIGSALGSTLGQLTGVPEARMRLLVACGAAGGISATFNAPIAGVLFSLELILRDFEAESFGVVVLASVAANVVGRAAFGAQPFLALPEFSIVSLWEFPLYGILGALAAGAGVLFIRVLYGTEDFLDRIWRGPAWLRPAVGGIALGLVLLVLPQLYGVGYPPLETAIRGEIGVWLVLLLLFGKIVATSLTIGIGGSGGVFAPSLFIGAMLGAAFGHVVHGALPGLSAAAGAYGLVGMGAVFAAAARAPLTAAIIMFELTGEYRIILPLMLAIALATALANRLTRDTVYTMKLRRRGISIGGHHLDELMDRIRVEEAMSAVPEPLVTTLPLADAVDRFARDPRDGLPVIDADRAYRGTVSAHRIEQALQEGTTDGDVGSLSEPTPALRTNQTLAEALDVLVHHHATGLPVLGAQDGAVVGWLSHRDVLTTFHRRLAMSSQPAR